MYTSQQHVFKEDKRMLVVAKFGGSSVKDAKAFKQVAKIIENNINIKLVILSAVSGITDKLITIFKLPSNKRKIICQDIVAIHQNIIEELGLNSCDTNKILKPIINELFFLSKFATTDYHLDQLLAIGERLSTIIITELLKSNHKKAIFYDARELIITDKNFGYATPRVKDIKLQCFDKIIPKLKSDDHIIITQGFIGGTREGLSTTLGRGGSDYSAALFAEAINANLLEIYTDVKGVYTGNPNLISNAKLIPYLSYHDMAVLSKFGTKVLHPATIIPCKRMNIPILIKCTFNYKEGGTLIKNRKSTINYSIKAIALLQNQFLITLNRRNNLVLNKIYKILKNYNVKDQLTIQDKKSINIVIDKTKFYTYNTDIYTQKKFFKSLQLIPQINIEKDLALLTLIGKNFIKMSDILQNLIKYMNFPIRILYNQEKFPSISLLVQSDYAQILLEQTHKTFFELKEEELFSVVRSNNGDIDI
jgi:aspartate kinase